ncbi:hypothetical protein D3C85_1891660 [compost metagenome]
MQLRKPSQQDLGLRADATADLEQAPRAAVIDVVEDRRLGQSRLFHQACLLGLREPVQVWKLGGAG